MASKIVGRNNLKTESDLVKILREILSTAVIEMYMCQQWDSMQIVGSRYLIWKYIDGILDLFAAQFLLEIN